MALLRDRAGDYVRSTLAENSGDEADMPGIADMAGARCSADLCLVDVTSGGRHWRMAATRSGYLVPWEAMMRVCRTSDIVVSDRRLPPGCTPRWLKLDRTLLAETGGVAVTLGNGNVRRARGGGAQPWLHPPTVMPLRLPAATSR